jgi:hypothetical protein
MRCELGCPRKVNETDVAMATLEVRGLDADTCVTMPQAMPLLREVATWNTRANLRGASRILAFCSTRGCAVLHDPSPAPWTCVITVSDLAGVHTFVPFVVGQQFTRSAARAAMPFVPTAALATQATRTAPHARGGSGVGETGQRRGAARAVMAATVCCRHCSLLLVLLPRGRPALMRSWRPCRCAASWRPRAGSACAHSSPPAARQARGVVQCCSRPQGRQGPPLWPG